MELEHLPYGVPVLLDTVTILQIVRGNDVGKLIDKTFHVSEHWEDFFVSAISVGELLTLTLRNRWSEKKKRLLDDVLNEIQILDRLDDRIIQAYADLTVSASSRGRGIGQNDLWIAAFAKTYDMVLLTMDRDFSAVKDELFDLRIIE